MKKIIFIIALLFFPALASALEIQKVVSPKGVKAWLVEESTLPIIAIHFAFGKKPDPKNYSGTSALLAAMLDEGAGQLNSQAFQTKLESLFVKMRFDADHDAFYGSMRTLTKNKKQAFQLLALALNQPTFAPKEIEKIRAQLLSIARARQQSLRTFAREQWYKTAFGNHPYALPVEGIEKDIKKIKRTTLQRLHKSRLTRANLHISVVGAITAEELAPLLDEVFAPLPEGKKLTPLKPKIKLKLKPTKRPKHFNKKSPQSIVYFGLEGLERAHPDFMTYYLMNHILGGGHNSYFFRLARERLGLVYSIYSQTATRRTAGFLLGTAATRNHQRAKLQTLIKRIFARMRARGVSEKELALAKTYIIGSYALNFDTSLNVAENLTYIQQNQLGIDYVQQRENLIKAVKVSDVNRLIKKILIYDRMAVITAGGDDAKKTRDLSHQ